MYIESKLSIESRNQDCDEKKISVQGLDQFQQPEFFVVWSCNGIIEQLFFVNVSHISTRDIFGQKRKR